MLDEQIHFARIHAKEEKPEVQQTFPSNLYDESDIELALGLRKCYVARWDLNGFYKVDNKNGGPSARLWKAI